MKANCWAKGRGREGQGPKGKGRGQPKKEQAATAAADSDDAAWMAYDCRSADIVLDDCGDIFDDLFGDSDDDPESSNDENSPAKWIHNEAKGPLVEDDEGEAYMQYEAAMLACDCKHSDTSQTELYDSGTSQHMSSYCNRFINFVSIVPKAITAANQLAFDASG
jgi:hypothetical protein